MCERAYMSLRRYASLIVTLLSLMLTSGLSELNSLKDVMFVREKLALDKSDLNALKYFREQFFDSHRNSFKTKFDWFFHSLNHRNK